MDQNLQIYNPAYYLMKSQYSWTCVFTFRMTKSYIWSMSEVRWVPYQLIGALFNESRVQLLLKMKVPERKSHSVMWGKGCHMWRISDTCHSSSHYPYQQKSNLFLNNFQENPIFSIYFWLGKNNFIRWIITKI